MEQFNCELCPKISKCKRLCPPIDFFANGNSKLKEKLIEFCDGHLSQNYNDVLSERINQGNQKHPTIQKIRAIKDLRIRIVAAALHAHIEPSEIATLLKISIRHVRRLCHKQT